MVGCPKHRDKPSPTTCSLCAAWASVDKENQRLGLVKQKLDLDRQILKAEKKKIKRSAQVAATGANLDRNKLEGDLKKIAVKASTEKADFEAKIKELEQKNRKIVEEWELKFSKQNAELMEAKAQMLEHNGEADAAAALIANSTAEMEKKLDVAQTKVNNLEEDLENAGLELAQARNQSGSEKQKLEEEIELLKEEMMLKETSWKSEHDILKAQMEKINEDKEDKDDDSSLGSNLQQELLKTQYEKETASEQVIELETKCRKLEAEVEEHRGNCEDLEEDLYELKLKLNKRQVEHERKIREMEERIGSSSSINIIGSVGANTSCESIFIESESKNDGPEKRFKTAKELSQERQIKIDQEKLESKVLAMEVMVASAEKEKEAAVEEAATALKESRGETYELAMQLDKLQKEMEQIKFNKAEESVDMGKKNMEELLQAAKDEASDLAQQLEALEDKQAQNNSPDQHELLLMKEEMDILQEKQEQHVAQQKKDLEEWNTMIEDMMANQSEIFGTDLPALDSKVHEIDSQVSELMQEQKQLLEEQKQLQEELEKQSEIAIVAHKNPLKPPPAPNSLNRRADKRRPPLTKMDSRKNRHVTEFNFRGESQAGKYTGFLNLQNLPEGHGILRVDTGDVYEGEWKNGKRNGQGVYTWYDGDLYTGPWLNGKRHGHGVFVYSDGRLYDGEYNMGQREGQGMFSWPYGAKYEGSYFQDKRNGMGVYVYADGRTYKGEYKDDRPHGYGVESAKDGATIYDGNWAFGEFIGDQHSLRSESIAGGSIVSYKR